MGPTISPLDTVVRIAAALLCGLIVGLERERLERAAGIRTHALVAVGAALITIISAFGFSDVITPERTAYIRMDPSRVAAQIVSGIGFLGAGVIIFRTNTITGLTTAASVWTVAGIGMACGGAMFWAAGIATAAVLFLQIAVRPLEYRLFAHHHPHTLAIRLSPAPGRVAAVEQVVERSRIPLRGLRLRPGQEGEDARLEVALGTAPESALLALLERLGALDGVRSISYRRTRMRFSFNGGSAAGGSDGAADGEDPAGPPP